MGLHLRVMLAVSVVLSLFVLWRKTGGQLGAEVVETKTTISRVH